jgi:hypothetical protein
MGQPHTTEEQIKIDAHDVMRLREGGHILRTVLNSFSIYVKNWKVIAPNGESLSLVLVDAFKRIAKFELEKETAG